MVFCKIKNTPGVSTVEVHAICLYLNLIELVGPASAESMHTTLSKIWRTDSFSTIALSPASGLEPFHSYHQGIMGRFGVLPVVISVISCLNTDNVVVPSQPCAAHSANDMDGH